MCASAIAANTVDQPCTLHTMTGDALPPVAACSCVQTIHTVDEAADITLAVLERHGVTQAAFVGHSYGTCIAARIVRVAPHTVHTLALLDPVRLRRCCCVAARCNTMLGPPCWEGLAASICWVADDLD